MHLYKTMKSFLFDQDYFIDLWEDYIHVFGIVDILLLEEKNISLVLEKFTLTLEGFHFRVLKLTKNEILVKGVLEKASVKR